MTDDDEHARVVERLLGLGDGVILNLYAKLIELFEDAKRLIGGKEPDCRFWTNKTRKSGCWGKMQGRIVGRSLDGSNTAKFLILAP